MGVISVGASLGVREAPSGSSRRPAVSGASPVSSTPSSRKKQPRKRLAASTTTPAASVAKKRTKTDKPIPTRSLSPTSRDVVVTQVVAAAKKQEKPMGRMVHVKTSMDSQKLAPHVIGVNGGKLNAVMAQARCSISYRKPQEGKDDDEEEENSMAFMISATTNKRIEDGVQLLQAVVESTEQQLRKFEQKKSTNVQEEEQEEERRSVNAEASTRSTGTHEGLDHRHPKRRREGGNATSSSLKRGRSNEFRDGGEHQQGRTVHFERSERHHDERGPTADVDGRAEEERSLRDEREAFRIRLERTAMISKRLAAESTRARAREVLERDKYLRLLRQVEEMHHRKKVAEHVVKEQCRAMTSALSSSSSSKKKKRLLEIEQLSIAHDAIHTVNTHMLPPNLRSQPSQTKRGKNFLPGLPISRLASGEDDELARLVKRVQHFGKMITFGSSEAQITQEPSVQSDDVAGETFDFPSEDVEENVNVDDGLDDSTMDVELGDGNEEQKPQCESFRSTWDLPGLARDLNLIQDYSSETDCKLLRFLAGERQYFYLEPLLPRAFSSSRDVKRWILTPHDLQILHRYLSEHMDFAKELVLSAERLRALGNLVPPLPSSSDGTDALLISELGVFESSRHTEWSAMQDKMVKLHSLCLVAHLLGKHYLARQVLGADRDSTMTDVREDILGERTLQADLFTYILRPIRSSAIESSLFDSLPISLVRETIEQCPEVVNHVLQWKDEEDVPLYLREVDPSDTSSHVQPDSPNSNYFLRSLLLRVTGYLRELDVVTKGLVSSLSERRPSVGHDDVGLRRQHLIDHVNRFKSVTTDMIVENTKLQLHKWWVLFADHACAWFDPEDVDEMDDRSYDKFTCLQDALYVWHNEALLYSTKDDFATESNTQVETPEVHRGYNTRARKSTAATNAALRSQHVPMRREEEVASLLRLTPSNLRDELQNRPFTEAEAKKRIMTPLKVDKVRSQLEGSLRVMSRITSELGHAGPWRVQMKHSNVLKRELAKQIEMQKKLVTHQWARYYTKYHEFATPPEAMVVDEDASEQETSGMQPQGEPTSENGGDAASIAIDWTGVFDPVEDAPDVIEMKKLRHEITLAKDQLLRDMGGSQKDGSSVKLNDDQVALMEECQGLAASCMQALGKFLGDSDTPAVQKKTPKQSRSTAKTSKTDKRASLGKSDKPKATSSDKRQSPAKKKTPSRKSTQGVKIRRSEALRVAKALAAPNLGLIVRKSSSKAKSTRNDRSRGHPDGPSPLRMGCSGCRDLRRRCTGCSGCCLHCVCVSCGCRMCCSSRMAAVQKSLTSMVDVIEATDGCKWLSGSSSEPQRRSCGMLCTCDQCQCCNQHCSCSQATATTGIPNHTVRSRAGSVGSSAAPRRERRFRINPEAAQRRGHTLPTFEDPQSPDFNESSVGGRYGARGPLPTFDYGIGIDGAFPFGDPFDQQAQCRTWRPAPSDKNEQEDLFRAARVRMKLHRSTFTKSTGLAAGSGCLDGEQLWQPERIRMMWERRDFHGVLGLPRNATVQQIKRQYRKLALKLHPDKASDTSASLESTVAETGKGVGAGKRVDAFVAATHSYKILLGDEDAMTGLA